MKLSRPIETWRKTLSTAVVAGSHGQVLNCIDDAKADILSLHLEVERLQKLNAALMGDDENQPRYTPKRLRAEVERAKEQFIAEFMETLQTTD